MKPDNIENELGRPPVRRVPAAWRDDILAAANQAAARAHDAGIVRSHPEWSWKSWFWPCPQAWGGLACAWILIGLLQAGAEGAADVGLRAKAPPPEVKRVWAAQRALWEELMPEARYALPAQSNGFAPAKRGREEGDPALFDPEANNSINEPRTRKV